MSVTVAAETDDIVAVQTTSENLHFQMQNAEQANNWVHLIDSLRTAGDNLRKGSTVPAAGKEGKPGIKKTAEA